MMPENTVTKALASVVGIVCIAIGISCTTVNRCHSIIPEHASAKLNHFVRVEKSVVLEYTDWGGSGEALIFIPGHGNSAHVFDEFAPRFSDTFRVYGLTRRGFGYSSKPKSGYDFPTLARDVITFMDSMHISRATLVGHSIGRAELTWLGALYGHRISSLIYLDAAYIMDSITEPDPLSETPDLINKIDEFEQLFYDKYRTADEMHKAWPIHYGVPIPLSEVQSTMVFDKKGNFLRFRQSERACKRIIDYETTVTYPYRQVTCPALLIFASVDTNTLFQFFGKIATTLNYEITGKDSAFIFEYIEGNNKDVKQNANALRTVMPNSVVAVIPGEHHIFLSSPDSVEMTMRQFLDQNSKVHQ